MTGTQVYRQGILQGDDSNNFNFGIVSFDAGSRNKFHKHSGDQILIITEGTGKVATDNEVVTVNQGDVVLIPAGENHWHGAPDNTCHGAHHGDGQGKPDGADGGLSSYLQNLVRQAHYELIKSTASCVLSLARTVHPDTRVLR